jgi:selenide,water dikinase
LDKAREAGCAVLGGHTIRLPEPIYGMSVTGIVHPGKILINEAARPGDLLLLTKPLGTGIATTAIKRGMASAPLVRRVIRSMKQINSAGAELAERGLVRAATDVTGFGLLGHLGNIVRASRVAAEIIAADAPIFGAEILSLAAQDCVPGGTRSNLAAAEGLVEWGDVAEQRRIVLADAQTSGGLLLCVPPRRLVRVRDFLLAHRASAVAVVGRIVRGRPRIHVF